METQCAKHARVADHKSGSNTPGAVVGVFAIVLSGTEEAACTEILFDGAVWRLLLFTMVETATF